MRSRDGADDGGCGEITDETAAPLHEIPVTHASVLSGMRSSKSDAKETEEAKNFAGAVTKTKLSATAKGVESEIVKAESKTAQGKDVFSKTYVPQANVSYTEVRSIQSSPTPSPAPATHHNPALPLPPAVRCLCASARRPCPCHTPCAPTE